MEDESVKDRACLESSARRGSGVRCESSGFRPWKLNHGGSVSLVATQCVLVPGMVFESPDFRSS